MNYYHSGINQMLADNFWQQWAAESQKDKNILRLPIGFQPFAVTTTPATNNMLLGVSSILGASIVLAAIIKSR